MKNIVALIGRPNVGKSTLFNRLVGYRHAIVEDTPGVTRDRLYGKSEWQNKHFTVVDTGGISDSRDSLFVDEIKEQVDYALLDAEVVIFLVDGREGINPLDWEIADYLRTKKLPVILAVNKIDSPNLYANAYEFYNLGFPDLMAISAEGSQGIGDLLDIVTEYLPEDSEDEESDTIKVAIVGRPNVGKSSLTNRMLGENRMIVSPMPGTTRDSIDSLYHYNNQDYLLIDTAGLRRKSQIKDDLERFSASRAVDAIDRSDIVLLVIDANEGLAEQDKRIAGLANRRGKGCVIVVNKWDAYPKDSHTMDKYKKDLMADVPFLSYAPIIFVSALTGQRLNEMMNLVEIVAEQQSLRIPTANLNTLLEEVMYMNPPPTVRGKQLKIFYITQVGIKPPTFVVFVNSEKLMHFSYLRYLENRVREVYSFTGTPLVWKIKERERRDD